MNFKEALQRNVYFQNIVYFQDIDIPTNPLTKGQLQANMNKRPSKADMKGKGKTSAMQPKEIRKASAKISVKHESVSIETISFEDTLLAKAMYSCGEKSEILQEVLCTDLTFQGGEFRDLPFHIKLLFDNFQVTFTLRQKALFQKTLKVKVFYLDVYNVISKINQLDRDISIISLVLFGLIIGKNMILYVMDEFKLD